jgi:formylglycine-generating enzyme required for sulfatase activity
VVNRLSGQRQPDGARQAGPLRLITVGDGGAVNLIHETLIRSKGLDAAGKPQPYWPTLWDYIEQHKERAAWRERLRLDMQTWLENGKAPGFQWSHERVRELHKMMQKPGPRFDLDGGEHDFLGPIDPDAMPTELERPETTHKRRLLIGERLAVLGDPRPGVGVDERGAPQIDWQPVKGGEVTISILSDPNNPNSKVKERTRKRVGSFQIARHPVTVSQYRAFLDAADGWCDQACWGNDLYRDPDGTTYEFGRFGNHPAVYVGWFDTVAFCRWLSRRVGLDIRFPDGWQWQLAATGGDDRNVFAWGADWDVNQEPWRANAFESRLGQPTAVGMYPAGATLAQAAIRDMAGTVWEWCLNKFDRPEESRSRADDFDTRVLRGGSWSLPQDDARSAYRIRNHPDYRFPDVGFRVVCVANL